MDSEHLKDAAPTATDLPTFAGIPLQDIVLVKSKTLANQAFEELTASKVVGFDTESKPTFLKGEVSTGPHLIQLATETRAFLFPITASLGTKVVKAILESPHILKVGFGLGNDRSALKSRLDIDLINVLDLGEELRGPNHRGTVGAKTAVAQFFGEKLQKSKKIGTSNWANPQLSDRQLLYAANDAYVALKVFQAWLKKNDNGSNINHEKRQ